MKIWKVLQLLHISYCHIGTVNFPLPFILQDEVVEDLPVQIPVLKPDPDKANPKIGISLLAFSADNKYLATKNGESQWNVSGRFFFYS